MNWVYETLLYLGSLLILPKVVYQAVKGGKYRNLFAQRVRYSLPLMTNQTVVWIHAVSVGETKAVSSLAKQIYEQMKEVVIIVSSITETGHAEAKRSMPFASHHVFLPLDFLWNVKRLFRHVKPKVIVVTETDLWYNFLHEGRRNGAQIVLVNGKVSARSAKRYAFLSFYTKALFGLVDCLCVQSQDYAKRFAEMGVEAKKIKVTGNLKFDESPTPLTPANLLDVKQSLGINEGDPVIVIGSTHDPEERELLHALQPVWNRYPNLRVVIVPRHPERFDQVAEQIATSGLTVQRYSQGPSKTAPVILVDTMGLLRNCYQVADIAIVAGSFTSRVGGHNILEPLYYGIPVLFGPYMQAQPELTRLVLDQQAGLQITLDDIAQVCIDLLDHPERRLQLGAAGKTVVDANRGATQRTWNEIASLLRAQ